MQVLKEKRVLVAALDWGIGHATRCVPIIRRLQNCGYVVMLASGGTAKEFFKEYFPELLILEKPAYKIIYSKKHSMATAIFRQLPSIILTIIREHFWLKKIIRQHKIAEVVSDNCYGLWNNKIHSVFITHQLKVKCPPRLKFLESTIHSIILFFIKKYDECYIPDLAGKDNYSGSLSHGIYLPSNAKYVGILSRFSENKSEIESNAYDAVIFLSGPEPQRTIFENKCVKLIKGQKKKCCIIRGLPGNISVKNNTDEITWFNHLPDNELKSVLQSAKKVICRSGYSTIMDLVELNVKAMLVATPGQTEQEYLAMHNKESDQFEVVKQERLTTNDFFREVNRPSVRSIAPYYY